MSQSSSKPIVLIVDDEPSNIAVLAESLRDECMVKVATSGEKALKVANTYPHPDLILLDIVMPGRDGYQVCGELKQDEALGHIPVIFITSKDQTEDELRGLDSGAVDYIKKPVILDVAISRVMIHLNNALAEKALRSSEERFRIAAEVTSDLIYEWDADRDSLHYYAEDHRSQSRVPQDKSQLTLDDWLRGIDEKDLLQFRAAIGCKEQEQEQEQDSIDLEYVIEDEQSHPRFFRDKARVIRAPDGKVLKVIGSCLDITESKQAEQQLRLASAVFSSTDEGVVISDSDGNILLVNEAFSKITGFSLDELEGRSVLVMASAKHSNDFYKKVYETLLESNFWSGEVSLGKKQGADFPARLTVTHVRGKGNDKVNYVAVIADVTAEKENLEKLESLATRDTLTGLPNRFSIINTLKSMIVTAEQYKRNLAVYFIDLDGFKLINDSMGHDAGDLLLIQAAARFSSAMRTNDIVGRLGGDEFIVIAETDNKLSAATAVADKLIQCLDTPFILGDSQVTVTGSIGGSLYPDDGVDVGDILRNADTAMYSAKASGKNLFVSFSSEMTRAAKERFYLENELRTAVSTWQFELYYQPQVELSSGRVFGCEALVRWQHPTKGLVMPIHFIPAAEQIGIINEMGTRILMEACMQAVVWRNAGIFEGRMSVNVSPFQTRDPHFLESVYSALEVSGIPPECLELEVTESALLESESEFVKSAWELRKLGVRIAIDDFGTGYSALSYLKDFPVDTLKIDKSFTAELYSGGQNEALLRAIVDLSQSLNMDTLAEGVETQDQQHILLELGCAYGQGFYYLHPEPGERFIDYCRIQNALKSM
ncbi:MAG: EAL domain-containing protein [Candidatus Sedimenticola sp. (ex Thyasira tokunagai)]